MPIYEYRCEDCETSFETYVRANHEIEDAECPTCHGGRLSREMSVFAAGRGNDTAGGFTPGRSTGGCCGGGCGCC